MGMLERELLGFQVIFKRFLQVFKSFFLSWVKYYNCGKNNSTGVNLGESAKSLKISHKTRLLHKTSHSENN